jgi:Peptidase C13 family
MARYSVVQETERSRYIKELGKYGVDFGHDIGRGSRQTFKRTGTIRLRAAGHQTVGAACILFCLTLLITACAVPDRGPQTGNWKAVLVAGDSTLSVFDNATQSFQNWLLENGVPKHNIHRMGETANPPDLHHEAPANLANTLLAIALGAPFPDSGCLIFATSHGVRDTGLSLSHAGEVLLPEDLAKALSIGCANVPTVVIISGCYSGVFATGAMPAPTRIILTAARLDRMSFGCQAGRTFTAFDQCLLSALPEAITWRTVFERTAECVDSDERALGETPSLPQAYFGSEVADLPVRF